MIQNTQNPHILVQYVNSLGLLQKYRTVTYTLVAEWRPRQKLTEPDKLIGSTGCQAPWLALSLSAPNTVCLERWGFTGGWRNSTGARDHWRPARLLGSNTPRDGQMSLRGSALAECYGLR